MSATSVSRGYYADSSSTEDEDAGTSVLSSKRSSGIHDWTEWRRQLNDTIIDVIEERHKISHQPAVPPILSYKHTGVVDRLPRPEVVADRNLSDFVMCLALEDSEQNGKRPCLHPGAFLTFGLPRVKLTSRDNSLIHQAVNQSYHQKHYSSFSQPSTSRSNYRLYRKRHEW